MMKKGYYFVVLGVIILIMFSLFNVFKNKDKVQEVSVRADRKNVALNESFELKEGDRAILEDLFIYYKNTSFPPDSYTGDREEFTYPQIEVSENGDTLRFPINKKLSSKVFHRYEIKLIEMNIDDSRRSVSLEIISKEINSKILEEEAVERALEEARKNNLENGEATNRILEYGLWKIEVGSKTIDDIYIMVEVDANTGEIRNSYKENRA